MEFVKFQPWNNKAGLPAILQRFAGNTGLGYNVSFFTVGSPFSITVNAQDVPFITSQWKGYSLAIKLFIYITTRSLFIGEEKVLKEYNERITALQEKRTAELVNAKEQVKHSEDNALYLEKAAIKIAEGTVEREQANAALEQARAETEGYKKDVANIEKTIALEIKAVEHEKEEYLANGAINEDNLGKGNLAANISLNTSHGNTVITPDKDFIYKRVGQQAIETGGIQGSCESEYLIEYVETIQLANPITVEESEQISVTLTLATVESTILEGSYTKTCEFAMPECNLNYVNTPMAPDPHPPR